MPEFVSITSIVGAFALAAISRQANGYYTMKLAFSYDTLP